MKREIKFRLWRDGRMQGVHTMYSKASNSDTPVEPQNFAFSSEEVLMQFIGRKDKANREIYEGDIILMKDERDNFPLRWVVVYNEEQCGFRLRWEVRYKNNEGGFYDILPEPNKHEQFEIIGNIHSPQLVK